ncbi:unnamed protein product [Orchesella dallaii]|uniref:HTH CENPB-type domain-containing protein n=1 Tax=Orchesella dallaii TaxID=48710 RepID=A0ABP1R0Z3_9HEXA
MFSASHGWVNDFKKRYGISSRKITRLVSKNDVRSMDEILKNAAAFQVDVKRISSSFSSNFILNTDQAGFTYEITSSRTLTFKGEQITMGISKSPTGLATHSYSVQYMINMSGEIVGDVFMCLQEKDGRIGPIVQQNLPSVPNVTLTCSKSGKLTRSLFAYFLDKVVLASVKEDFVLVLDSWNGQTNATDYQNRFGVNDSPNCQLKIIPKRCTSICQPLDTTFHRQLKYFARRLYEEFFLFYSADIHPADELTTRNNIIIMHSLLHNQFSAPIFKPMLKYSWYSSGLTDERVTFLSTKEVCFSFDKRDPIKCEQCGIHTRFLKCAYCRIKLCFNCFFYNFHYHF